MYHNYNFFKCFRNVNTDTRHPLLLHSNHHQNLAVTLPKTVTEAAAPVDQAIKTGVATVHDQEKEVTAQMTRKVIVIQAEVAAIETDMTKIQNLLQHHLTQNIRLEAALIVIREQVPLKGAKMLEAQVNLQSHQKQPNHQEVKNLLRIQVLAKPKVLQTKII